MTRAMDRLHQCREEVARTDVVDANGRLDRDMYLVARTAEARMTQEIANLGGRLDRFDKEITQPVRERLRAAVVRERAVETLVVRRAELLQQEIEKRENLVMDEHARLRWRAARAG